MRKTVFLVYVAQDMLYFMDEASFNFMMVTPEKISLCVFRCWSRQGQILERPGTGLQECLNERQGWGLAVHSQ